MSWTGPVPAQWAASFHCAEPLARELVCAAVRETFEESGVLLASAIDGSSLDPSSVDWEADRLALLSRERSLSEVFAAHGVTLRADLLRPWAHWITPEAEPRRYDTKFFTAAVPAGQEPRNVSGEADEAAWVRVVDALAENEQGTRMMLPPTLVTLTDLVGHATVADVLEAAPKQPLTPVVPRLVVRDGREYVEMPDGSLVKTPIRLGPGGSR
ncbi:MAG: NUDIX hydrolase [Geodermatophilaceae bacterium]|nr:NUDIX hydrolase [Geodermatophilaceae bacterium]